MFLRITILVAFVALATGSPLDSTREDSETDKNRFPDGFLFGVATAAYQIEGAWEADGKGENVWDHMLHDHPEFARNDTGDVADDSYHLYKKDVQMVKEMNMDFYRFSISWARILPDGQLGNVNDKGIAYYNDLIDELIAYNITPVVTMYHWDLPYELQLLGGWANREIAKDFVDYADLLFKTFGDRVKWWIPFNEPMVFCRGYSGNGHFAPDVDKPGLGDYLCGHTLLLAHAHTYKLYNDEYREEQEGKVGITLNSHFAFPKDAKNEEDRAAAERELEFWLGWFANPIFSEGGNYPLIMRETIAKNSEEEGLSRSRLPEFTAEELELLKGSADFFGLNHYTSAYATSGSTGANPSRERDSGVILSQDPSWQSTASSWFKVKPDGFRALLNWIQDKYSPSEIFITENGFSDDDGHINDKERVEFYRNYLKQILYAIYDDNINVIGYAAWTLMDNFEWNSGYSEKFGVYKVDVNDETHTRTAKDSSMFLAIVADTHEIPNSAPAIMSSLLLVGMAIIHFIH